MEIAVVAVGYNRPDSMRVLLGSLLSAKYEGDKVDLVISIDKGAHQDEIIKLAEKTGWSHGEKIIRAFPERQGLRSHILQCGDFTQDYDAVIVLEDDLIVSPYFYSYVKQAVYFYGEDRRIGGISLYKHQFHPGVSRPFEPENNGHDAYLMQFAQSWGQCWTRHMWQGFKSWYECNKEKNISRDGLLPEYIARWNQHSWLKYYMRYIVEKDLFFIYPIVSLTTNASDVGQHCRIPNNDYQVSLLMGKMEFRFPQFEEAVKYDVFFERIEIEDIIFPNYQGRKILDMYGNRTTYGDADYVVSTRECPYKKLEFISLTYRPIEQNCITPKPGKGVYLYDLHQRADQERYNSDSVTRYDVKGIHWKKLIHLGWSGFKDAVVSRFGRK